MVFEKYFSLGILVLISRYIFIYTFAPNYSFHLRQHFSGNCFPFVLGAKVFLFLLFSLLKIPCKVVTVARLLRNTNSPGGSSPSFASVRFPAEGADAEHPGD